MTIYTLVKRERQFSQIFSSNRNLNRGRYLRLISLSSIEVLCTIPMGTYILAFWAHYRVKYGWSHAHDNGHYSAVFQIPASYWKNNVDEKNGLEMFRWLLVACALLFFAFFGFADEARRHYRLAFKSIATRVGYSTSSGTLQGSSNAYVIPCAGFGSIGSQYFQYFVFALYDEQRWFEDLRHNKWRQTRFDAFIQRPTFDSIHLPCR